MTDHFTERARELRKNSTDAERLIWSKLRNSQIKGVKFRRQQPIGNYIIDFVSFEKRIIVELDGGHHAEQTDRDEARSAYLQEKGYIVLRFWNNEVFTNLQGVLTVIYNSIKG